MSEETKKKKKKSLKRERESGNLDVEKDEANPEPGVVMTRETGSLWFGPRVF